ncbi:MAG: glycosyltransferase family 2 protein [Nanobdellota archaeon]
MGRNDWVVIPAKNEEENLEYVLQEAKNLCRNLLVIDDASSDRTADIAERYAEAIRRKKSLGKGAALRQGCDEAVRKGAEKIVVMDADGQHEPSLIPLFLDELEEKEIIFGSRKINREMPLLMRIGNFFISLLSNSLFHVKLKDTQCGFRAFTASAYKRIRWKGDDYSMESEMIARAGKHKLKYSEMFVKTLYHDNNKGTTVLDGIRIVLDMIRWKTGGLR